MTTTIKLTDLQRQVLEHAIDHTDDQVVWLPEHLKAGPRAKVLQALEQKDLITSSGGHGWFVTDTGYAALGRQRPKFCLPNTLRAETKQAKVINMLRRPQGATIEQLIEATGWQAHTVRGTFAGSLKKKLGLNLTSEKPEGSDRIYRIPN